MDARTTSLTKQATDKRRNRLQRRHYGVLVALTILPCCLFLTTRLESSILKMTLVETVETINIHGETVNTSAVRNTTTHETVQPTHDVPPVQHAGMNYTMGFIHIGKTGGSRISTLLHNGCHSFNLKLCRNPNRFIANETIVSKMTGHYYHTPDFTRLYPMAPYHTWLISIRDPFDRTASAFCYEHPQNVQYTQITIPSSIRGRWRKGYNCFPSFNDFCYFLGTDSFHYEPVLRNATQYDTQYCTNMARNIIHNQYPFVGHLYYNYQTILHDLAPFDLAQDDHTVYYVIRQEHLWDDWIHVNRALGQRETEIVLPKEHEAALVRDVRHVTQPVQRTLNPDNRDNLCQALTREYKVYFQLLHKAVNTNNDDFRNAVELAKRNCPNLPMLDDTILQRTL